MLRDRSLDRPRLAVALGAIAVRVGAVVALSRPPEGLHDSLLYLRFAQGISNGQGYVSWYGHKTSYYPPGYPWFLGVLHRVVTAVGLEAHFVMIVGFVQAVLGGIAAWAIVGVAARVVGHDAQRPARSRCARVAGLSPSDSSTALCNTRFGHSAVLLSEGLFVAAFSVSLLGFARLLGDHRADGRSTMTRGWWGDAAIAGVALGVATLTRPQVLTVVVAVGLAAFANQRTARERIALIVAPCLIAAVVVLPWSVRNVIVFDRFVAVSTNGGDNLCIGFNPSATGHFGVPEHCDTGEFYIDGPEAEARRNAETARRARAWAIDHAGELPLLSLKKLRYTYDRDDDALKAIESFGDDEFLSSGARTVLTWISNGTYVVLMVGVVVGAVGLVGAIRRNDPERSLAVLILVGGAVSAVLPIAFFGEARFKVPTTPFFAVMVGYAIARADLHRRGRSDTVDDLPTEPAVQGSEP